VARVCAAAEQASSPVVFGSRHTVEITPRTLRGRFVASQLIRPGATHPGLLTVNAQLNQLFILFALGFVGIADLVGMAFVLLTAVGQHSYLLLRQAG